MHTDFPKNAILNTLNPITEVATESPKVDSLNLPTTDLLQQIGFAGVSVVTLLALAWILREIRLLIVAIRTSPKE